MTPTNIAGSASTVRRNVFILAICQALSMSGASLVMTVSALAGQMVATDKSLATLPLAMQFTATMLSTIPASLLMGRIGRRAGFTIGQVIGLLGAGLACWALFLGDFWLFVLGSSIIGVHNAFWQYYRFAAADTAGQEYKARAISYVLAGGVIAALLGPQISKWSVDFFSPVFFAGGYIAITVLSFLTIILLQLINIPKPNVSNLIGGGRLLTEIIRQPKFILAVMAAMFGYGAMNLVMTATPLAMNICGFDFSSTATVIQAHVLAMFAPSFFTGHLIKRFGLVNVIIAGTMFSTGAIVFNLLGVNIINFACGLILIGLGWNFMFIGGTTLLTETYQPEEQAKVQALNDFLVFGTVAITSFSSGAVQEKLGWTAINWSVAFPITLVFVSAVWFKYLRPKSSI